MPGDDLLSSLHALALIVFAGDRRLCFRHGDVGDRVSDFTLEALHIHIRIPAAAGNPKPSASATSRRTDRESSWNFVGSEAFPGCANVEFRKECWCIRVGNTHLASVVKTTRFSIVTADKSDW
jgi:hypothetical protein